MIPETQIAITLYGLREHCGTEEAFDTTLARLKEIGYGAVQFSGVSADIPPGTVRRLLDRHELYCCAAHDSLENYRNRFDEVVEKMRTLNCSFTALGYPGEEWFRPGGAAELAEILNDLTRRFREEGITFGYHNHHREFASFGDAVFLEELAEKTDSSGTAFEIDTHWVQRGGGRPDLWISRMAGRCPVLHLKDFRIIEDAPVFAEPGEGNLHWPSILQAASEAGVRWYVVEQDSPVPERDIFASAALAYENLREMGLK